MKHRIKTIDDILPWEKVLRERELFVEEMIRRGIWVARKPSDEPTDSHEEWKELNDAP